MALEWLRDILFYKKINKLQIVNSSSDCYHFLFLQTAVELFKAGFPYQTYADITWKWVGFGERGVAKIEMESTQAVSNMTISPIDMQCQVHTV